jgi:hypothetical protein
MKRIIAAVSFAALVVPALALAAEVSPPFEKSQFDRILPNVEKPAAAAEATRGATSAPNGAWATGPWANDQNFIAPAR